VFIFLVLAVKPFLLDKDGGVITWECYIIPKNYYMIHTFASTTPDLYQ